MLKKILKLVFLMCFICASLYAEEVALVTDLSGEVTALESADKNEKQDTKKPIDRHEWQVEVADMLPAGAEVRTGEKSELTIIHLADDTEYHLEANSSAKITATGVESSTCASTPLQLVSTKLLQLGDAMQHQVGAVVADREIQANTESSRKPSLRPRSADNKMIDFSKITNTQPAPEQQTLQEESTGTAYDSLSDEENLKTDYVKKKEDRLKELESGRPVTIEAGFALPQEMISEICKDNGILNIEGYTPSFENSHEGWLDIKLAIAVIDKDIELKLNGDTGHRTIILHVEAEMKPSVALAWRLEKSGLLAQAASIWMSLQTEGMDSAKVALHLKRIKNKLLAKP